MRRVVALGLVLAATPASAQTLEVSPLVTGGYTTSAAIDKKTVLVQDLEVAGGFTWGGEAAYFVSDHLGFEGLWTQQRTEMTMTTTSGSARLFDMKVGQLHGNVVYQLGGGNASIRPFVFAGLGAAFFSADDLDNETKLSWTLGGGIKWFPLAKVGARAHVRYKPTRLNDTSSSVCDPFGFCQASLPQTEFAGGLVLRF
jgi:outer membrane protein W